MFTDIKQSTIKHKWVEYFVDVSMKSSFISQSQWVDHIDLINFHTELSNCSTTEQSTHFRL